MDNDDREEMESHMKNLLSNQNKIEHLTRNDFVCGCHPESTFVDATLNLLQKTIEEVNGSYEVLQERIDNNTKLANEMFVIHTQSIKFLATTRQMEEEVRKVGGMQLQIMRILMDTKHAKVSSDLLKPEQLSQDIRKINEWLPEKPKLPGGKGNQVSAVLRLLTARTIIVDGKLV